MPFVAAFIVRETQDFASLLGWQRILGVRFVCGRDGENVFIVSVL
mgnify:CR=1 FL=1